METSSVGAGQGGTLEAEGGAADYDAFWMQTINNSTLLDGQWQVLRYHTQISYVLLEVAEHLVRFAGHGVTAHATGFAEEEHGTQLLLRRERGVEAARITIDGRVRVHLRELRTGAHSRNTRPTSLR